jgi:RNA polymerase sigma-70 factor (ECF subfamily)
MTGMADSSDRQSRESSLFREEELGTASGCPQALGRLLERYRPHLLKVVLTRYPHCLDDKVCAMDLVQETIIAGWRQFAGFRGNSRAELARWLQQILRNTLKSALRACSARKRDTRLAAGAAHALVDKKERRSLDEAIRREQHGLVKEAVSGLPVAQQRVLQLRYWSELSFAQIGALTGQSEEAARKLLARSLVRLRKHLDSTDGPTSATRHATFAENRETRWGTSPETPPQRQLSEDANHRQSGDAKGLMDHSCRTEAPLLSSTPPSGPNPRSASGSWEG